MFYLLQGTRYWGMLVETGIWPLQSVVKYHSLMSYQKALIDGDIGRTYNLDMILQNIKKKSEWKRQAKEGI